MLHKIHAFTILPSGEYYYWAFFGQTFIAAEQLLRVKYRDNKFPCEPREGVRQTVVSYELPSQTISKVMEPLSFLAPKTSRGWNPGKLWDFIQAYPEVLRTFLRFYTFENNSNLLQIGIMP